MSWFDKMQRGFALAKRKDNESKGESIPYSDSPRVSVTVTVGPLAFYHPGPVCIYCGCPTDPHTENFPYCSRACGVLAETQD